MSVNDTAEVNPSRGRQDRADTVAGERRRRRGGTLNRMVQYKLDCIPAENLDLDNFVYRWVNDEPGKMRMATQLDDYDFVQSHELGADFNLEATDSESSERVRMFSGRDQHGNPVFTYLVKKLREFWIEDNEEVVERREAMMAGRVYEGDADGAVDAKGNPAAEYRPGGSDKFYVPSGTVVGSSAERKKGPIPRRLQKA